MTNKPKLYMLCGQSGVGKTTMANLLKDKFTVMHYDKVKKGDLNANITNSANGDKPLLIDIPIKVSTTYKKYIESYDVICFFILESVETVTQRISARGGALSSVQKRHDRMNSLSRRYGTFSGNWDQVYEYLKAIQL